MTPRKYAAEALAAATDDSLAELSRPLTSTERSTVLRKRRTAAGLAEVRGIWARPEAHTAIKSEAAKITGKPRQPFAG
jgi:hypothetical protein